MRVKDVMTSPVESINPDGTVTQAAQRMKASDVGILPVVRGDQIVGTITDRDIVLRAIAQKLDPQATRAEQIMSRDAVCCFEDDDLQAAARTMEDRQVHRLLVLGRDNTLTGILSIADIACKTRDEHLTYEVVERVCEPAHAGAS